MKKMRLPPIGFLSYARQDDELSGQKLSKLRKLIKAELQLQYGREKVKLFQDVSTIPHGAAWERETLKALNDSTFFIPIITPNFIQSEWCCREVNIFLERERQLFALHPDLPSVSRIFPIDYRRIREGNAYDPEALEILKKRQWCDFQDLRDKNPDEETVSRAIYDFAESICDLLLIEVEAPPTAEELAARSAEAEAARKQAEAAKRKETADARKRARDEERMREAAAARSAEDERLRREQQQREEQGAEQRRRDDEVAAAAEVRRQAAEQAETVRQREEHAQRAAQAEKDAVERARREAERHEAARARRAKAANERAARRRDLVRRHGRPVLVGTLAVAALLLIAFLLFRPATAPSPVKTAAQSRAAEGATTPVSNLAVEPTPDRTWLRGDWGSGTCAIATTITLTASGFNIRYRGRTVSRIVDEARSTEGSVVTDQERFVRDGSEVKVMEGEQMAYRLVRCVR